MKPADLAAITAAFLHSSLPVQVLGALLTLVAATGLLWAAGASQPCASAAFALALGLAAALAHYALRIQFDARVFAWLAAQPDDESVLAHFDSALTTLGLRSGRDPRDLAARAGGARHLVTRLALIVLGQLILVLLGVVFLYAHL